MDLIVYQVMQLHVMHETDRCRVVELFARTAIAQLYLAVGCDRNALPLFSVVTVIIQVLQNFRINLVLVFSLELFPAVIDILVRHIQGIHDVIMRRAVKVRRRYIEAQNLRGKRKVQLQDLSDIHTGRYAQRVQNNIQRTSVRKIRHIFNRKYSRYNTLVSVAACHLIADRDLSLLRDIDADSHVDSRRDLSGIIFSCEDLRINDRAVLAVRNLERSVSDFSCLLAEDGAQEPFLRGKLCFALRGHLADKDIAGTDLRADTDNTVIVQIFERVFADTGNVSGNLFRSQLGISRLALIFLNVNGGIDILSYKAFGKQNRVLIVVAFPAHEADQRVLAECEHAVVCGSAVSKNVAFVKMVAGRNNRLLVIAVRLVGAQILDQFQLLLLAVVISHIDFGCVYKVNAAGFLRDYADARVTCRLFFHAGSHDRSFRRNKRNALTLHV